ncbi:MAG: hypothetical protein AAFY98_06895, partial [Verrucomicrobiota bacterium]
IPRKDSTLRTKLIRWLRSNQFRKLQDSLWVSPWPIGKDKKDWVQKKFFPRNVLILKTTEIASASNHDVVNAIWDDEDQIVAHEEYRRHLKSAKNLSINTENFNDWVIQESLLWKNLIITDWVLPVELQPKKYFLKKTAALRAKQMDNFTNQKQTK